MLKNWLKIYFRNTIKNKGFTLLTILGLAIGISGVIFSTLYWKDETSYDQWNPNKDRVFELITNLKPDIQIPTTTGPMADLVKKKSDKIEETLFYQSGYSSEVFIINQKKELLNKIAITGNNFFDFFPFDFIKGSKEQFKNNRDAIAIEEQEALRFFGNESPINKQIKNLNGEILTIYGVYQLKTNSGFLPKYVISSPNQNIDDWNNFTYALLIKLKNASDKANVEKEINKIYYENIVLRFAKARGVSVDEYLKSNGLTKGYLQVITDSRLNAEVTGLLEDRGNLTFLKINLGLSILILLLSIINYINLSTAQTIRRAKEVGIRKVFGASKQNIIWQFLFETSITTVFALMLALTLVEIALPSYNILINKNLSINLLEFLPYLILTFIIVILFAGIFPAIYVSNFKELNVLKGNFTRSKNGIWLRNSMLIFQFSIATFFIVAGGLVTQQVNYMSKKDLGFSGEQVVNVSLKRYDLKEKRLDFYKAIKQDLLKIKGVKEVNISSFKFGNNAMNSSPIIFKDKSIQIQNVPIDYNFLQMMKIKLKNGRDFDQKQTSDSINNIILNETASRELGNISIGDQLEWNEFKFNVIGIVNDFNIGSPENKIPPMMLINVNTVDWLQNNLNQVLLKIESENASETIAAIEKFWKTKVDNDYPFEYEFIDKQFARSYENYTKQEKMFKILNVIVITIALFGLFALSSYTIERKYKEIAIRKVLGAETSSLLTILSKQYVYFALIGFVLAIVPSYYFMQKWLENFAYRIDISIWIYAVAFCMLLSLTLIVVLIKAYAATRINSLNYLKYE
ncbi:ABC transporter permease [Empedobacter stercoris]|uniref:FtsX-like permease family protein n=1 Tax=Empedobacter stercoris TaxID=1628248 RepID=A0ABX1WKI1_9FLAO|nr:ABC transporter permease [Empedobacter stercoris]NOJ75187.1 FtsX-like permease family protein [Empedobacter stercoris]